MEEAQVAKARKALDLAYLISNVLNTEVDRQTLSSLVALCELGVNPEALAVVVKEHRREAAALTPRGGGGSRTSSSSTLATTTTTTVDDDALEQHQEAETSTL